ncbi:MAG: family 20 glycosylhydrolase, partial [Anaerolineae bacterium]
MSEITIVPAPSHVVLGEGTFALTADTVLVAAGPAAEVAKLFAEQIAPATGFALSLADAPDDAHPAIAFVLDEAAVDLGAESYRLTVTPTRVTAYASKPAGLFYAAQSLRQLLPPEVFCPTLVKDVAWTLPCVEIEDAPRFGWRGAMLDVCRHFMPKDFVLRFIDLLALHKLNVFHWHLTDDQGWRIEIKKYPRLTEVG